MSALFKKAAIFTDIHWGKKNNDRQHNLDCENFINWFIHQAKEFGAETAIFMGDWHDNRHSIHVSTLNYSLSNLEKISRNFEQVFFIPGNHDLYYKEKREISSVSIGRNLSNVILINDFLFKDDVTFCPWLVGNDWEQIPYYAKKSKYMFGHFELPHFMMNAQVEMPDHGQLNVSHFDEVEIMAFSGHFHKRQVRNKVCYIGNTFPHSYSDAWDNDRGMVLLEWNHGPIFKNWLDAPKYKTLKLSELLENPLIYLDNNTFAKITSDVDLNFDELQFIKDIFFSQFAPRKVDFISNGKSKDETEFDDDISFQSIDQIVIEGLNGIDSLTMDKNLLIEIYRGLN